MTPMQAQIDAGLRANRTVSQIARDAQCSSSNISQHIARNPALWPLYRKNAKNRDHLAKYRDHLALLERDARNLARRLRRALRVVEDELIELEVTAALD